MARRSPGNVIDNFSGNNYLRRGPGSRTVRRREIQRERRKRTGKLVALSWVMAALLIVGITLFEQRISSKRKASPAKSKAPVSTQEAWLMVGTVEAAPQDGASWLSIFAYDSKGKNSFALYMPNSTLVEIPGHGQEAVAKALSYGQAPLQVSTVSNLLGVGIDHYLQFSDQSMQALVDKMGGIEVEVQSRLTQTGSDGRVNTIFAEGKQNLNGARASQYLIFSDPGGDEISRAVRHATFWAAVLDKFRGASKLPKMGKELLDSRDLFQTDSKPGELTSFFDKFASVPSSSMVFETLPVKAIGVDTGKQYYGIDAQASEQMVERYLKNARPAGAGRNGRRVEILNGNGRPGIGQLVSDKLIPRGYRIVLNQNAKNFNYDKTEIVVYSNSKAALTIAEDIRKALGVGDVIVSLRQQTLVDITIVVGKDYPGGQ